MTSSAKVFQGASKTLHVQTNIDLTTATEIELRIDTPSQIVKTLGAGDISAVTASQFDVAFVPADTRDIIADDYLYQVRATMPSGKVLQGKFAPNKFTIRPSIFESISSGRDYN